MPAAIFASVALALAAQSAPASASANVPMFERAELDDGLSLVTYGVIRDTRCPDPALCLQDERLVVATVIRWNGREREYPVELGVPLRIAGGWLTLVSTTARPQLYGATRLDRYGLSYVFER